MSDKDKQARERAEAEVNERIQATLSNPKLVSALADLRAVTPAGEQLFGFKVEPADARSKVPNPEVVEPVEGAAIVADRDAAAAYVRPVSPVTAAAPRMPTGRVRLSTRAASADPRRQSTQPSIAKGGHGPRPPALDGEMDDATPAVLERPAASVPLPTSSEATTRVSREPSSRRGLLVAALGLAFAACLLAAIALRAPKDTDPSGATTTSASVTATAPAALTALAMSSSSSPSAIPPRGSAPTATVILTTAPSAAPSSPSPSAPGSSQRPSAVPRTTGDPPTAPNAGTATSPPAAPPSTADPVTPPAPTVAPSTAPVEPQPTSKPLIYD